MICVVENSHICNFADDTIPHSSGFDLKQVMLGAEHDCYLLIEWFCDSYLTLNADVICSFALQKYTQTIDTCTNFHVQ